nr:hypothetical protein CFP56_28632 [Quercus suber]
MQGQDTAWGVGTCVCWPQATPSLDGDGPSIYHLHRSCPYSECIQYSSYCTRRPALALLHASTAIHDETGSLIIIFIMPPCCISSSASRKSEQLQLVSVDGGNRAARLEQTSCAPPYRIPPPRSFPAYSLRAQQQDRQSRAAAWPSLHPFPPFSLHPVRHRCLCGARATQTLPLLGVTARFYLPA